MALVGTDETNETRASTHSESYKQGSRATGSGRSLPLAARSSHHFDVASPASGHRCRTNRVTSAPTRS